MTFNHKVRMREGQNRTASKKRAHVLRAMATRHVLPGFPLTEPFQTKEAVDNYFAGDKLICLRCGKSYKELHTHLRVHGWTDEGYRQFYCLPLRRRLCGNATRQGYIERGKELQQKGILWGPTPERTKQAQKAIKRQSRYKILSAKANLPN